MRKIIVLLTMLMTGCASTQVRVGVLHDFTRAIEGDNPMAVLEVSVPVKSINAVCGWTHISHYSSGAPFNKRYEENADTLGCYWRIK